MISFLSYLMMISSVLATDLSEFNESPTTVTSQIIKTISHPVLRHWPDHDFGGSIINEEVIDCLGQWVSAHHDLKGLSFHNATIGEMPLQRLLEALAASPSLVSLNLSGLGLKDSHGSGLGNILSQVKGLQHLNLSSNNLGQNGLITFLAALPLARQLETLDLSHLYLDDACWKSLEDGLYSAPALKRIALRGVGMGADGLMHLLAGAAQRNQLIELNLAYNALHLEKAAGFLAELIHHCPLAYLDLRSTGMTTKGVLLMAEVIQSYENPLRHQLQRSRTKTPLLKINLYNNNIDPNAIQKLYQSFGKYQRKVQIIFGYNNQAF